MILIYMRQSTSALIFCEKFGGHKYAAGLSVKKENINAFIDAFEAVVSKTINEDQLSPKVVVDMKIDISDINEKLVRIIKQFFSIWPKKFTSVFMSQSVTDTGYGKVLED